MAASHLRALADTKTTAPIKARLLREAEEHERLTREEESLVENLAALNGSRSGSVLILLA